MTSLAQAQAYTTQERARQCEPKQKDDGRHGGQGRGQRQGKVVRLLEATLKRGPRVSGGYQGQKGNSLVVEEEERY